MENDKTENNISNPYQLAALYMQRHGALVFGVVTVLAMWLVMVVPELDRNQTRNEILQKVIEDLRQQAADQKEIAIHLQTTSQILDRITLKMDSSK